MNKMLCKKIKVLSAEFVIKTTRKKIAGYKQYELTEGQIYVHALINGEKKRLVINTPAGFICDSTSLPYASDSAGDIHDFGYCTQSQSHGYTRLFWDKVYYFLMLNLGYWQWQAYWRYAGVRIFGLIPYRRRRREKYQMLRARAVHKHLEKWGV
jgi:hypothetical protein